MRFTYGQGLRMPPQYTNSLALVANVQERQALPAGYQYVVINSTANVYCRLGAADVTASVPGDVEDGTASELNPTGYVVHDDYSHISIISPSNCIVTLAYYPLA